MIVQEGQAGKQKFVQRKTHQLDADVEAERKAKLREIRRENKKLLDAIEKRKNENQKAYEGKYNKVKKLTVQQIAGSSIKLPIKSQSR